MRWSGFSLACVLAAELAACQVLGGFEEFQEGSDGGSEHSDGKNAGNTSMEVAGSSNESGGIGSAGGNKPTGGSGSAGTAPVKDWNAETPLNCRPVHSAQTLRIEKNPNDTECVTAPATVAIEFDAKGKVLSIDGVACVWSVTYDGDFCHTEYDCGACRYDLLAYTPNAYDFSLYASDSCTKCGYHF
jgi:hypothetical protein